MVRPVRSPDELSVLLTLEMAIKLAFCSPKNCATVLGKFSMKPGGMPGAISGMVSVKSAADPGPARPACSKRRPELVVPTTAVMLVLTAVPDDTRLVLLALTVIPTAELT